MSIILDIPFDESTNSAVAYDYSVNQKHAKVTNATFQPGHTGYAIHFTGNGYARSKNPPIDLAGDFTVAFWVRQFKSGQYVAPGAIHFLLAYSSGTITGAPGPVIGLNVWTYITMTKSGNNITAYYNGNQVVQFTLTETPVEWGIKQGGEADGFPYTLPLTFGPNTAPYATADMDELIIFNEALTPEDIKEHMADFRTNFYLIDGVPFKEFDVYVEGSAGLVDALELKEPTKTSWAGEHGEIVDLFRPRHLPREISLDCWIRGGNMMEWTMKQSAFLRQFQTPGLHRLECRISEKRPLLYTCYMASGTEIEKEWKNGEFFGRFTLELLDPQPVRRILRFMPNEQNNGIAKIRFACPDAVNVYWGDGTVHNDVLAGGDLIITHQYSNDHPYYEIMITGEPDNITNFSHNCIVVWSRL